MSLARVGEGQDCTDTCPQRSTIDEAGDLRQILACDVDQKKRGFNAMTLRKMLKRTRLCFAADQINDCVRVPNLFLEALGLEVKHRVCVEGAAEPPNR